MRKISVKIKLDNATEGLLALKQSGIKLGPEFSQFDRLFLPANYKQVYKDAQLSPKLILRTDTIRGKESYSLIMKRMVGESTTIFFQTQVYNFSQTSHIITQIGYEFYGDIEKLRRQALSGSVTISIDKIKTDDWFLKIEQTLPLDQIGSIVELNQILESIGLKDKPRVEEYIEIAKGDK